MKANNKVITANVFFTASGVPFEIVQFRDYFKTYLDNVTNVILNDNNFLYECKEKLKIDINVSDLLFDINNNTFKKQK